MTTRDTTEQLPPGEIITVSECVLGEVYWTVAMGTVRDGCVFVRARYEAKDDAYEEYCHLFVTLPEGEYQGGEKSWYAADEEVIDPRRAA